MADPSQSNGRSSFWTQADALLRKNLIYQRRNKRSNVLLISFPLVLCVLLIVLQMVINNELNKAKYRCGCAQVNGTTVCGIQYSTSDQAISCPIPSPPKWPALIQIPSPKYRASRNNFMAFSDLPSESCKQTGSCPVTTLITGKNQTFGLSLSRNLLSTSPLNSSDILGSVASNLVGSASYPGKQNFIDSAFSSGFPLYIVQPFCRSNMAFPVAIPLGSSTLEQEVTCAQGLYLWRNSSSDINDEVYKGYRKGNPEKRINEIVAAYDFLNSNTNNFNVSVWYNATFENNTGFSAPALIRVPRLVNLVSNAYLQSLLGPSSKVLLEFVKEMPKPATRLRQY